MRPSIQPGECKPSKNASRRDRAAGSSAAKLISMPIRRTRSNCCARATSGHAAAPLSAAMTCAASLDHVVGARNQRLRYFEPERRCSLKVDHQLVPGRRLHREVGRLLALEDAIDVAGRVDILTAEWP